jgi:PKD repeat protein
MSVDDPALWNWSFGDSTYSSEENPVHAYSAGIYAVNLSVSNAAGSSTMVAVNYITVHPGLATAVPTQVLMSRGDDSSGGEDRGPSAPVPVPVATYNVQVPDKQSLENPGGQDPDQGHINLQVSAQSLANPVARTNGSRDDRQSSSSPVIPATMNYMNDSTGTLVTSILIIFGTLGIASLVIQRKREKQGT